MLYKYLTSNYKGSGSIFFVDIHLPSINDNTLQQMFKKLCDSGKIRRFDTGIYYLPSKSQLKRGVGLIPELIASYKYIERDGRVDGYYSGFTFSNMLGITMQVPYMVEIVSNSAGGNYCVVSLGGRKFALRRPRTEITAKNQQVLQFLYFLKDFEEYAYEDSLSVSARIGKFIEASGITKNDVDQYISLFPDKTYKNFYDLNLYDVLT